MSKARAVLFAAVSGFALTIGLIVVFESFEPIIRTDSGMIALVLIALFVVFVGSFREVLTDLLHLPGYKATMATMAAVIVIAIAARWLS
jgi:uncharacterized membrane protein